MQFSSARKKVLKQTEKRSAKITNKFIILTCVFIFIYLAVSLHNLMQANHKKYLQKKKKTDKIRLFFGSIINVGVMLNKNKKR